MMNYVIHMYTSYIHVNAETNRPPSVNEEPPDLINLEADDNSEEKSSTYKHM